MGHTWNQTCHSRKFVKHQMNVQEHLKTRTCTFRGVNPISRPTFSRMAVVGKRDYKAKNVSIRHACGSSQELSRGVTLPVRAARVGAELDRALSECEFASSLAVHLHWRTRWQRWQRQIARPQSSVRPLGPHRRRHQTRAMVRGSDFRVGGGAAHRRSLRLHDARRPSSASSLDGLRN